jgi:hypothetical protein
MKPRAKSGLLSQPLEDELILYDHSGDRCHSLNRTAALVWRLADGEHSIEDMAAILRKELDPAADENLVWHALDHLNGTPSTRRRPVPATSARRGVTSSPRSGW